MDKVRPAALPSADGVAQVSKPAVSRVSKPANRCQHQARRRIPRPADLEVGDTAGLETCATDEADPGARTLSMHFLLPSSTMTALLRAAAGERRNRRHLQAKAQLGPGPAPAQSSASTQEFNATGIGRKDAMRKIPKLLASLRPMPFALKIPPVLGFPTLSPSGRLAALSSAEGVARVSKPAVSRVSKPANRCPHQAGLRIPRPADLEGGDTAGLETCATYEADPGARTLSMHLLLPSSTMTALLQAAAGAMKKSGQTHHLDSYCRTSVTLISVIIGNLRRLSVIYGDLRFFFCKAINAQSENMLRRNPATASFSSRRMITISKILPDLSRLL